jgi:hypothetical protein
MRHLDRSGRLPVQNAGGRYENNPCRQKGLRSGRSVPRFSGQIGHVSFETRPLLNLPIARNLMTLVCDSNIFIGFRVAGTRNGVLTRHQLATQDRRHHIFSWMRDPSQLTSLQDFAGTSISKWKVKREAKTSPNMLCSLRSTQCSRQSPIEATESGDEIEMLVSA